MKRKSIAYCNRMKLEIQKWRVKFKEKKKRLCKNMLFSMNIEMENVS